MPFDRAAYMREYRAAKRDGKPTTIRGGTPKKETLKAQGSTDAPSVKKETHEPDASPLVSLIVLVVIVAVIICVFYFNSRGNTQGRDEEDTAPWRGR